MKPLLSAFVSGVLFAVGLVIAQMTVPDKVIAFLDLAGTWDPSLAFVMVGAICFHAAAFRLITRRNSPILSPQFYLPTTANIDRPLLVGATLFGVGWALGGFCPGPAITSLVSASSEVGVFVLAMLAGMLLNSKVKPLV